MATGIVDFKQVNVSYVSLNMFLSAEKYNFKLLNFFGGVLRYCYHPEVYLRPYQISLMEFLGT